MGDRQEPDPSGPSGTPPVATGPAAAAGEPDDGRPVVVRFDSWVVGDVGHPDVDRQILDAILAQGGRVGRWLADCGVDRDRLHRAFGTPPDLGEMLERSGRW